jgi:antitoxin component YwqK of YwqJK toxin-antitoxin module
LVWWYEDGQKKEEVNFIEGDRDGFAYWWYKNGAKKGVADISSGLGVITLFSEDKKVTSRFDVKDNQIFCKSGEIFSSVEKISKLEKLPIGDGSCDCADCSDENN